MTLHTWYVSSTRFSLQQRHYQKSIKSRKHGQKKLEKNTKNVPSTFFSVSFFLGSTLQYWRLAIINWNVPANLEWMIWVMIDNHSITHLSIIRDVSSCFVGKDTLKTTLFRFLFMFLDDFRKTIRINRLGEYLMNQISYYTTCIILFFHSENRKILFLFIFFYISLVNWNHLIKCVFNLNVSSLNIY